MVILDILDINLCLLLVNLVKVHKINIFQKIVLIFCAAYVIIQTAKITKKHYSVTETKRPISFPFILCIVTTQSVTDSLPDTQPHDCTVICCGFPLIYNCDQQFINGNQLVHRGSSIRPKIDATLW